MIEYTLDFLFLVEQKMRNTDPYGLWRKYVQSQLGTSDIDEMRKRFDWADASDMMHMSFERKWMLLLRVLRTEPW